MIAEPCPYCGAELYDRVLWDPVAVHAICPACRCCVQVDCPCDGAAWKRAMPDAASAPSG